MADRGLTTLHEQAQDLLSAPSGVSVDDKTLESWANRIERCITRIRWHDEERAAVHLAALKRDVLKARGTSK